MKHARRIAVPLGIAGVTALALTGCVGGGAANPSAEPGGSEGAPAAAVEKSVGLEAEETQRNRRLTVGDRRHRRRAEQ